MAKKPGSWKNINKLTGKARVVSSNGRFKIGIFSLLFVAGIGSFATASYFFISKIIDHDGIKTTGPLPNWDFEKGNGFSIDLAEAPINHVSDSLTEMVRTPVYDDRGVFLYTKVKDRSLRLQHAYNDIFKRAPKEFIVNNPIYKVLYPNANKVEILNIYTDSNLINKLNLDDVNGNNFNVLDCILYLEISYDGIHIDEPIVMPTIIYGNEGFLSNFLQFNLLNIMHKDEEDALLPEHQSSILGSQSNSYLLDLVNGKDSDGNRKNTDNLYENYSDVFDKFFEENIGTEFLETDINPYSNFVISGANKDDSIDFGFGKIDIDDTKNLLDMNQLFSLSSTINLASRNNTLVNNKGIESVKHLASFILFFKNIYLQTGDKFAFDSNYFNGTPLAGMFENGENRYVTSSLDSSEKDEFYFMFLPEQFEVRTLLNKLKPEILGIVNEAINSGENGSDLMIQMFEKIQKDLLKKGSSSKYWWLFESEYLPFQSYWTSEAVDYTVSKDPILNNETKSLIDKPNLNKILIKNETKYDLNKSEDMIHVFSDLWSTSLYGKDINKIDLNKNSEISDEWLKNTNSFLSNLDSSLLSNKNSLSMSDWDRYFEFNTIYLDEFNKPIDSNAETPPYSVDIILTKKSENTKDTDMSSSKLTFRMKINWTN